MKKLDYKLILTIISMCFSVITFLYAMSSDIKLLRSDINKIDKDLYDYRIRNNTSTKEINDRIIYLQGEVKTLSELGKKNSRYVDKSIDLMLEEKTRKKIS